jgi:uncharacterized protein YciI
MISCFDGPDAARLRIRDLDGHLAHVEAHWRRYLIAGPLREPGQDALSGSLFLIYADSQEEASSFLRQDPYFTNGQYERIEIRQFSPSIGLAIGGKTWTSADALRDRAAGEQQAVTMKVQA